MLRSKLFSVGSIALLLCILSADILARQPQGVRVKVGNSSVEKRSRIKVEFLEMMDDSRCPIDTTCIWAGNAHIKIHVSKNGKSKTMELNSTVKNSDSTFAGYEFKLAALTPVPRSNIRIDRNGYVATISMTKFGKSN
jgi:hypothetical protein